MRRAYVVALEGIPGSGKTTLRRSLRVDGYSIDRVEQILPGDPQSDHDISIDQIIESDILKTLRATSDNFDIVLLDRYYLSTLAYQYSYDIVTGLSTYESLAARYKQYLKGGQLVIPDLTIHIDTPLEESYRRKNRLSGDEMWVNGEFLDLNRKYYSQQKNLYIIDGTKALDTIRLDIEQQIKAGINE
jgi:thymidylate kinase